MFNELNDVWFWAKVSGMCKSITEWSDKNDGQVWLSEDEREMLRTLSKIGPREAIKLANR
jgi:hypothetical protein